VIIMQFRKIIVYGTLKKGFSNSLDKFGGIKIKDITLDGWEMYTNTWYPQVVSGGGTIKAELWKVPEYSIKDLDSYEGHPSLFKRTPIEELNAEMYVFQGSVRNCVRLQSGIFDKR
jgi:gamma-glutamylcyclotransferase (GGCT)/AIG2-like uncharacterized protein YtfP